MSEVEFNEEQNLTSPTYDLSQPTGMVAWLINKNIVDNEEQAQYLSFGIIGIIVVAIFFVILTTGSGNEGYEQEGVSPERFVPGATYE